MAIWHCSGEKRLEGACFVQGAKNAVLPILAASVVCPTETDLLNVPQLSDAEDTAQPGMYGAAAGKRRLHRLACIKLKRHTAEYDGEHAIFGPFHGRAFGALRRGASYAARRMQTRRKADRYAP